MFTKHHTRKICGVALAALTALTVAACGGSSGSTSSTSAGAATGAVYNLGLQAPQGTIDPLTASDFYATYIIGLTSAQLVNKNPTTGAIEPQLASSWSPAANRLAWTFRLRPNDKFSNGKPVTPADVVWTFDQILAPKSQSPAASSFAGILKSVSAAPSGDAVVFTLDKPYSDFPYLLTGANTWVLPAHSSPASWVKDPVGAGQFVLQNYVPGQSATFKKNPDYWDASAIKLGGIDMKLFSSLQSESLAFQSGEIDQLEPDIDPSVIAGLGSTPHRSEDIGYAKFDGLVFNVTKPPFNNVNVRQAIAWALNRKQLATEAYQGEAIPANDVPTFPDYSVQPQGLQQREANPAKVKQLLSGISTPISFTITTYSSEQTLAETIQQQLDATGDFKVSLNIMSEGAYYAGSNSATPWLNAPVTITDWADRLPSQLEGLIYAKGSAWNASHYSNTKLDSLTTEFDGATSASKRQQLANQIAKIEWTDVPMVVAAFQKQVVILSPNVHGNFTNGQNFDGGFDFRGITVSN